MMGLFSSEYVTTVGTTVSRTINDKGIIPSNKTGLITGLFSEDNNQLVEHMLESMMTGMGIKGERAYSYAKRKYPFGLPVGKVSTTADGKDVVLGVVKTLTNGLIEEDYYRFGPLNPLHWGWVQLFNLYGYQSKTNQLTTLSAQKGYPVYLEDMVVVVKDATLAERANGSLEQWGTAAKAGATPDRPVNVSRWVKTTIVPTPFRVDASLTTDVVEVRYVWWAPNATGAVSKRTEVLTLPVTEANPTQDFFHVKYLNGDQDGYWLYRLGAGTHPEIDTIFNVTPSDKGQFFPFIYFRHGSVSMGNDKTSTAYKTSNAIMKTLGVDYAQLIDSIHENPSIGNVDQALMTFAVPPNTTNQVEQRYLFDFFSKMYLAAGGVGVGLGWDVVDLGDRTAEVGEGSGLSSLRFSLARRLRDRNTTRIRIEISDARLSTALSCEGIFKRKRAGVIAAVGSYASSFITEQITYTYTVKEQTGTSGFQDTPVYEDVEKTYTAPIDSFIYKHQISASVYEEIQVYDLKMTYYMWGGYSTIGDNLEAILLVPLDHSITKSYGILDREELYARSMHYVFNSRSVQEVKWYQQGWFGDLLKIAAIVITVLSFGADGGFTMQLAAVVAGTVTLEAFVMYIAMAILEQVIIAAAIKLFVSVVGAEFAFLIAIVAAVYGVTAAVKAGSIKGAPWAKELLALSSNLSSGISATIQDSMRGLQKEAEAFNVLAKERNKSLEDANKLLETNNLLSPTLIFGESPDDFYNRTVHSGNIGIAGIDSIASYVDIALTLPKLNDTLGSNNYV